MLDFFKLAVLSILGDVAVVVTDHLDEESLCLTIARFGQHLLLDDSDDALAVTNELLLDGGLVVGEGIAKFGVLRVLLDGGNSAASSALRRDQVLESDGYEVALVRGDIGSLDIKYSLKVSNHVIEAFGLLSNTSEENVFVYGGGVGHRLLF